MIRLRVPWQLYAAAIAMLLVGSAAIVAAYPSSRLLGGMFEADQKLEEALVYYRIWADQHPHDYDARWHTARLELAVARPADAIATLEAMAIDWPGDKAVLEELVAIEDSLLHVRNVIPRLDAITDHYPTDLSALRRLADHQRWFGDTAELIDVLERIAAHEQAADERNELADILLANRDYQRVIDVFDGAPMSAASADTDPRVFVAEAQKRMDQPERASETLLALLGDHPDYRQALSDIAEIWLERDRPDVAESYLERATTIDAATRRQAAIALYERASETAAARGDLPRAIELARQRVQLEPDSLDARLALADLHAGDADEVAVVELRALCDRRPDDPVSWRALAQRLAWLDRPREALRALDRAVALAPDDYITRRERARVLRDSGQVRDAIAELRDIAAATSRGSDAGRLFDVLFDEGRYRAAVAAGEDLRRPTTRQRRDLALAMAWLDDCDRAIGPLRDLTERLPNDDRLWRARRDCAIAVGDAADALSASSHLRRRNATGRQP